MYVALNELNPWREPCINLALPDDVSAAVAFVICCLRISDYFLPLQDFSHLFELGIDVTFRKTNLG